jgi:hypothetical protein
LLSASDLTTVAQVTAITGNSAIVEPMRTTYALNSGEARVNFFAIDPDHPGSTPVTQFQVTNLNTGTTTSGTGTSLLLSAQGIYAVHFWSTDSDDSEAAGVHAILIGLDRTGPSIVQYATPNTLWPPNGKLVTVTVNGLAVDTLTGVNPSTLSFHVIDEYGTVQPSGRITSVFGAEPTAFGGDVLVWFTFQVELQAKRHGYDFDGRQYLIVTDARDVAGNLGSSPTLVTVPHDMGHQSSGPGPGTIAPVPVSPGNPGKQAHGKGQHGGHHQSDNTTGHAPSAPPVLVTPIGMVPVDPGTGPGNGKGHHGNGNGNGNGGGHGNGNDNGNGNGNGHGHGKGG